MKGVRIEAAMIGLGVPLVTFGAAFAASYFSRSQLTIPWICAAAVSITAIISLTAMTREATRKSQKIKQPEGANDVENPSYSDPESLSRSAFARNPSIVDYATTEGGKKGNQDFADERRLNECNVLAIADGVSHSQHGELAAEAAVKGFLTKIEEVWKQRATIGRAEIREAYDAARAEIKKRVEEVKKQEGLDSFNPQTTFIGIIELHDRFIFTYIGDGAIALFRAAVDVGTALHSPEQKGEQQWTPSQPVSKSLLVPHSFAGFLTRHLSASGELPRPAYIEVDKALEGGEIVIAGTDGALPMGSVLKTSQGILNDVKQEFQKNHKTFNRRTVHSILLQKVEHEFTTDDNRTLGIILTDGALNSWWREQQRDEEQRRESLNAQE